MKHSRSSYARSLIEASLDPLVTISADGKIMDVNRATEKVTGVPRKALIGSDFSNYFTEPQRARDGYQLAFSQGTVMDYPLAICHASGKITEVLYNASVYRDEEGNVAGLFAAARDITALKKAQRELESAIAQMQLIREMTDLLQSCQKTDEAYPIIKTALVALFPNTEGGVYIMEPQSRALTLVDQWGRTDLEKLFMPNDCWGMRRGRIHIAGDGRAINPICRHVKQTTAAYICIPLLAHSHGLGLIHIEYHLGGMDPEEIQRKFSIAETAADSARLALANLTLREELHALSIRDPLTGLFNRRFLEEAVDRELVRMHRADQTLAIAILDIDHFKRLNDTYGHDTGDEVLRQVAQLMSRFRRGNDIVCRYGGEEFVIVMTEIAVDAAVERLNSLRSAVESLSYKTEAGTRTSVTASIGMSLYPEHGDNRLDLITRADQALYLAKNSGRNRVVVAD